MIITLTSGNKEILEKKIEDLRKLLTGYELYVTHQPRFNGYDRQGREQWVAELEIVDENS